MHSISSQLILSCFVVLPTKTLFYIVCLVNDTIYTMLKFTKDFDSRYTKAHICFSALSECFLLHSALLILALPTPGHDPKSTKGSRKVLKDFRLYYSEKSSRWRKLEQLSKIKL